MTLRELGDEYEKSAALIRERLSQLRRELKSATDPEEVWRLKRRIAELTPMLTQCNKISKYCRCYYEKGFYIGSGALAREPETARSGESKQLAAPGVALHIEKRTYTRTKRGN